MTYEFQYLMHLTGACALGLPASAPAQPLDWEQLFVIAREQQLLPMVEYALRSSGGLGCPEDLIREKLASAFPTVMKAHMRHGAVIGLLERMEKAGIRVFVAKGFAAAANYAVPDCRISSDTDLFVDPADEEKACEFLSKEGFQVAPRWENGHHAIATHPFMGTVEAHVRLYDELVEEIWFGSADPASFIQEPLLRVQTESGAYYTPGATDHLLFIILHMVKHFIQSGISLRMMLDIALFFKKQQAVLDTGRIWSTLEQLKYDKPVRSILWATVRYCGLQPEDIPGLGECDESHVAMILSDLEEGGWMGFRNHAAREAGWHEYNRQVMLKQRSPLQYRLYMLQWQHSFKLSTLFPGRKRLSRDYPWVMKWPILIPFAWLHRFIFKGFALIRNKFWKRAVVSDEKTISDESKQRVDMFRKLDML